MVQRFGQGLAQIMEDGEDGHAAMTETMLCAKKFVETFK